MLKRKYIFFKISTVGLNLCFSFSLSGCLIKSKELYNLSLARRRKDGAPAQSERSEASSCRNQLFMDLILTGWPFPRQDWLILPYLPTPPPPLGQDMTQGQFLIGI